jgi:hypothetical protein
MKRKPPPKPPSTSAEAEQDVSSLLPLPPLFSLFYFDKKQMIYRLNHTMEAKGAEMVGGYMMQAMDQGCTLMFIDHGQRHALRLVSEQVFPFYIPLPSALSSLSLTLSKMEALIDMGYSAFVERLIENNDILDQQFLHFKFVVLLNRRSTASSGRPSVSNISDKV